MDRMDRKDLIEATEARFKEASRRFRHIGNQWSTHASRFDHSTNSRARVANTGEAFTALARLLWFLAERVWMVPTGEARPTSIEEISEALKFRGVNVDGDDDQVDKPNVLEELATRLRKRLDETEAALSRSELVASKQQESITSWTERASLAEAKLLEDAKIHRQSQREDRETSEHWMERAKKAEANVAECGEAFRKQIQTNEKSAATIAKLSEEILGSRNAVEIGDGALDMQRTRIADLENDANRWRARSQEEQGTVNRIAQYLGVEVPDRIYSELIQDIFDKLESVVLQTVKNPLPSQPEIPVGIGGASLGRREVD